MLAITFLMMPMAATAWSSEKDGESVENKNNEGPDSTAVPDGGWGWLIVVNFFLVSKKQIKLPVLCSVWFGVA